jgi:hypothetical protein
MPDIVDDAFQIANVMYDRKIIGSKYITPSELKEIANLSPEAFDSAEDFLFESHYLEGTGGGEFGQRRLTASGIAFVQAKLRERASTEANMQANKQSSTIDVFISHSSQDVKIAEALITLLRGALNISANRIRCTSVEGYRLPVGVSTDDQLRLELRESKIFIALITPVSLQSTYVLFELGARWGANLHMVPLLAAGAKPDILPGPLKGLNVLSCDEPAQVYQLVHDIAKTLDFRPESPAVYQKCMKELVEQSGGI